MTLAAVPLGVSTAIYLQEYAPKGSRWIHLVRLAIQNLAGVPAIVFGLFGFGFFIQFVGRGLDTFFFGGDSLFRPAGHSVGGAHPGAFNIAHRGGLNGRGPPRGSPKPPGSGLFARRHPLADGSLCAVAPSRGRNFNRDHPGRQPRGRGSGAHSVHRRRLFSALSAHTAEPSIHGIGLPRLCDGHPIAGRGRHHADPLRHGVRAFGVNVRLNFTAIIIRSKIRRRLRGR
jgi:hypothetical protein